MKKRKKFDVTGTRVKVQKALMVTGPATAMRLAFRNALKPRKQRA